MSYVVRLRELNQDPKDFRTWPIALLVLAVLLLAGRPAFSQDDEASLPAESAASPELSAIEDEITSIEKQQDLIDAINGLRTSENTLLETLFPPGSATAPMGSLEGAETRTGEPQILAYRASRFIADEIAAQIEEEVSDADRIIISDPETITAIEKLQAFNFKTAQFSDAYASALEAGDALLVGDEISPGSLFGVVNSALTNLGDILQFFRVDRTFSGVTIDEVTEESIVALIVNSLRDSESSIEVYYPKVYSPVTASAFSEVSGSAVNTTTNSLRSQKTEAVRMIAALRSLVPISDEEGVSIRDVIQSLTDLNTGVDNFLISVEEEDLVLGFLASSLFQGSSESNSYILQIENVLIEGNSLVTNSFFGGRKQRFSASVAFKYMLFDTSGSLVVSDVVDYHTGYRGLEAPETSAEESN